MGDGRRVRSAEINRTHGHSQAGCCADRLATADRLARLVGLLRAAGPEPGVELLSGAVGVMLALCRTPDPDRAAALDTAAAYAERVLGAATRRDFGLAWDSGDAGALVGFAHGSSGIGYALREFATSAPAQHAGLATRCLTAADAATEWETTRRDDYGAWPDLRPSACGANGPGVSHSWCNGSAGVGLAG